jgi:hypothetical protein
MTMTMTGLILGTVRKRRARRFFQITPAGIWYRT